MGETNCEVCGVRSARYVCKTCGKSVCEECFDPPSWLCVTCAGRPGAPAESLSVYCIRGFPILFVLGFFLVFVGILVMMLAALLSSVGQVSGGGFIFIGPFPIGFGFSPYSPIILALAVILTVVALILFWVSARRR